MSTPAGHLARTIRFTAADGAQLVGDLVVPDRAVGAAIVCHPHPLYGGDRHNAVVVAVTEALAAHRIASLRFDFRRPFDQGRGERADAEAALDVVAEAAGDVPLVVAGYSFGAMIGASVAERATAQVLIAPPITPTTPLPAPAIETLLLVPAHDQFAPPHVVEGIVAEWATAATTTTTTTTPVTTPAPVRLDVIESTDHSITGRTAWVGDRAARWLSERLPPPSPL